LGRRVRQLAAAGDLGGVKTTSGWRFASCRTAWIAGWPVVVDIATTEAKRPAIRITRLAMRPILAMPAVEVAVPRGFRRF
jgi:hypothetical protein